MNVLKGYKSKREALASLYVMLLIAALSLVIFSVLSKHAARPYK
jgi:hypothetical protein